MYIIHHQKKNTYNRYVTVCYCQMLALDKTMQLKHVDKTLKRGWLSDRCVIALKQTDCVTLCRVDVSSSAF